MTPVYLESEKNSGFLCIYCTDCTATIASPFSVLNIQRNLSRNPVPHSALAVYMIHVASRVSSYGLFSEVARRCVVVQHYTRAHQRHTAEVFGFKEIVFGQT